MRTKSASTLIASARRRAGNIKNSFPADESSMLDYLDSAYSEIHDELSIAFEGYYDTEYEFTTTGSVESYSLPSDFQNLIAVDLKESEDNYLTIRRYDISERNADTLRYGVNSYGSTRFRYRLQGDASIKLQPVPSGADTIRLTYAPYPTEISDVTQTISFNHPAEEELVKLLMTKKIAMADERAHSEIDKEMDRQLKRLKRVAGTRDQQYPKKISDHRRTR